MTGFPINPPRTKLVDQNGNVTSEWYRYFAAIQKAIGQPTATPWQDMGFLSALPLHNGTELTTDGAGTDYVAPGAVTSDGITMSTGKVLGRTTAGTGAIEELSLSQVLDLIGSAAQGDILYRGASAWARLAAGTSGYVLTTQGASANPTWASAAGSGSTVLLATKTAASSATIDFTQFNSSLYASYLITIDNLVFSANARLWGYVSTDGGATWDSGANYDDNIFISTSSATATLVTAQTKLWFSGLMKGASATYANSCRIELADPSLTTGYRQFLCRIAGYDSTPTYSNILTTCAWKNTSSAYNALRFFPDTGNFTSGIFKLYGLIK